MILSAVSVSLLSSYITDKSISEISNSAEILYNQPEKENITKIISNWKTVKKFLKYVTKHDTVNEIDKLFSELDSAKNKEHVREICVEIFSLLNILKTSEKASGENIF